MTEHDMPRQIFTIQCTAFIGLNGEKELWVTWPLHSNQYSVARKKELGKHFDFCYTFISTSILTTHQRLKLPIKNAACIPKTKTNKQKCTHARTQKKTKP